MTDLDKYTKTVKVWALQEFGKVGPRAFRALIVRFGDVDSILEAERDELLEIDGLDEELVNNIDRTDYFLKEAEVFIDAMNIRDIVTTTLLDDRYPELFNELNDPPPIIFHRGKLPEHHEPRVAVVGTSRATNEGIAVAVELAGQLAKKGISIVSGLSQGIGSAAHLAALKENGTSYAVLGTGFDNIYPEENRPLAIELIKNGGIISEYRPDTDYDAERDIERNRLVVGLSQAVVVGEIYGDSKEALDTAKFCHQSGKLLFILTEGFVKPGRDTAGADKVLQYGAIPVTLSEAIEMIPKSLV